MAQVGTDSATREAILADMERVIEATVEGIVREAHRRLVALDSRPELPPEPPAS